MIDLIQQALWQMHHFKSTIPLKSAELCVGLEFVPVWESCFTGGKNYIVKGSDGFERFQWWHFHRVCLVRADTWRFSTMSHWKWLKGKSWVTGSIRSFDLWDILNFVQGFILHLCVTCIWYNKGYVLRGVYISRFCCLLNIRMVHGKSSCTIKCNCFRGGKRPRKD